MKQGKKICKTLKEIRLQVARANDIPYEPTECNHKGDCLGTCPKCEEEVRYIEHQLNIRRMLGKVATVAGVAMGVSMAMQPVEAMAQKKNSVATPANTIVIDSLQTLKVKSLLNEGETGIVVRGRILDEAGLPIIGATIIRKGIRKGTNKGEVSNPDGMFAIEVPEGTTLEVAYIGYKSCSFVAAKESPTVDITMAESEALMGDVVVVGAVCAKNTDDVYGHGR